MEKEMEAHVEEVNNPLVLVEAQTPPPSESRSEWHDDYGYVVHVHDDGDGSCRSGGEDTLKFSKSSTPASAESSKVGGGNSRTARTTGSCNKPQSQCQYQGLAWHGGLYRELMQRAGHGLHDLTLAEKHRNAVNAVAVAAVLMLAVLVWMFE
jgi:hypothetical protein